MKAHAANFRDSARTFVMLSAISLALSGASSSIALAQNTQPSASTPTFKGVIDLDVRKSTPDWTPYIPKKAPDGAPNVLFILYDDTGLAAWSPYGGRINMPTLDKLAAEGLTYTQFHTAALCSPTRSILQTGRNHHVNGTSGLSGPKSRVRCCKAESSSEFARSNLASFW